MLPKVTQEGRPWHRKVTLFRQCPVDEKVRMTTLVRAEPERVYDAMTTVDGLNAWFTTSSEVDLRPGGSILFQWKDWGYSKYSGELGGPVLEARRPERFVYKWKVDTDDYLTTVEIDFECVKDGTIVRLVEYSYEDTPTGLKDMLARATGWGEVLTLLKFYVEHGATY